MDSEFFLTDEEVISTFALLVRVQSSELAHIGALEALSESDRQKIEEEAKGLMPHLRHRMLVQIEDVRPGLAARVQALLEDQDSSA